MSRVVLWLQTKEQRMFFWFNHKLQHALMDRAMNSVTHLGGAFFTISATVCLALFGGPTWSVVGLQSLMALAVSHLPVWLLKKKYPRLRPYMVLPKTNICNNPLTDHSFPSGHTTAIFSIVIPVIAAMPAMAVILLPVAIAVGISRMYLGLHYPTDVLAGMALGTFAGWIMSALWTWNLLA